MKASIVVAALALGAAAVQPSVAAQSGTVHETRVMVGSTEPSPEMPSAARHEAAAVLAQAKRDCRKESRDDRQSCMQAAREDAHNLMTSARHSG